MDEPVSGLDDPDATTRIDVEASGTRVSLMGPALAVITLVAVIGVIWMGLKLVDLHQHAIDQSAAQQRHP